MLARLDSEIFILDIDKTTTVPYSDNCKITQIDAQTLEVEISKNESLNALFADLTKQGVNVKSLRNKANRLEELFIGLVEKGNAHD